MNIAEWSLDKKLIVWVLTVLTVLVGMQSFFNLSWLEDPEFTIKDAVIVTPYPGASAREVEEEVTNVIEMAVQELGQVKYVKSHSTRGMSDVQVTIKSQYGGAELISVWEQLRRKINDAQGKLPPGAGTSIVNDDFGDVYGVFVAISGQGFSHKELYETAQFLQKELLLAEDVKRIVLYGAEKETVYVEMDLSKMSELGISPEEIFAMLAAKNLVAESGRASLGKEFIPINPTGEFQSEQDFGELLIASGSDGQFVLLRDVAEIRRDYAFPPSTLLRIDNTPAIGLGISTVRGGNVITMGEGLEARIEQLRPQIPLGIATHVIALQSEAVTEAVFGFLNNLAQAVAIVVVVLLVFMGLRSGLIIGAVLFITVMGTFVFMDLLDVTLERISLGALIIALGMLVDNAIVVTDGMRVRMQQGEDPRTAARDIVGQTAIPLLAATIIAVLAFAAIGTSQDSSGEYCRTLFQVVMISLMFSWVTAVTVTPVFCATFLKVGEKTSDESAADAYSGGFYGIYKQFLALAIRFRWITVAVVAGMFGAALIGFGNVKQSFFPDSTRPQFYIDFFFPQATSIQETERRMQEVTDHLNGMEGVEQVATLIGGRQIRFLLTYTPEKGYQSFAQAIVSVEDYRQIAGLSSESQQQLQALLPEAVVNTRLFVLGPSVGGKIQLRISGRDPVEIRDLASKAQAIMESYPYAKGVRNEWGDMVKVVRPQLAEARARRLGIDRPDLAQYLAVGTDGLQVGVYREEDELLPIVLRLSEEERHDLENMGSIPIWSPAADRMIPADQILSGISTEFENPNVWRRDRNTMLTLHADVSRGLPSEMLDAVKADIEKALGVDAGSKLGVEVDAEAWTASTIPVIDNDQIPLRKPGYYIAWGGEAEDSARANAAIAGYVPIFFGLMILMVIILFNSIRKTLVIWLTVPMAIIGVTVGLLAFDQPFGFMALLGLMSLAGMLIKNAIVLIDQIDVELGAGVAPTEALLNAGASRLIPVSMAAGTTILGMLPLLTDAFFIAMAVTIMFGLGFATVLTLIFVPTLYATVFNFKA